MMAAMSVTTIIFSITTYVKNRKTYKQDLKDRIDSYKRYVMDKSMELAELAEEQKKGQISKPVWAKITQLHTERLTNSAIAKKLHISVSAVQRKLEHFTFKEDFSKLPTVLSWDEFSRNKGKLAFIAQDFETRKIVTILENNRQSTIKNDFYKYPRRVREQVKVVTVDMSGSYIPIISSNSFFLATKLSLTVFTLFST